jgi:SAM-dependent methyltransferase
MSGMALDSRQTALVRLGEALRASGYRFVSPTPETHRRVNARPGSRAAKDLRDVFGWSRPFRPDVLPAPLWGLAAEAEILKPGVAGLWTSAVRYSTLACAGDDFLFVHSAYPTDGADAVFFGPDSYRFAALLRRGVGPAHRLVDVGCGTGVGGLVLRDRAAEIVLGDVSPRALELAAVNVALAGASETRVSLVRSDVLAQIDGPIDVVIANPPYIADARRRLYRDGGGVLGIDLAVRIADESLRRLGSGGRLVLYTGTPIVDGRNVLGERLQPSLVERAASWAWEELDPDVFGEELDTPAYGETERLAVVALTATVA